MKTKTRTSILVECALCIAMACVLSEVKVEFTYGGSITAFSMVPILVVPFRHGTKWGLSTSFVYSILQLILGFSNLAYCKTLLTQFGCLMLDYVIAFTALGLARALAAPFGGTTRRGVVFGSAIAVLIRFVCSFISGVLIWGEFAPEGQSVWMYSLTYNGLYMLPELVLTVIGISALYRVIVPKEKA